MAVKAYILQDNLDKLQKVSVDAARAEYNAKRAEIMAKLKTIAGDNAEAVNDMVLSPEEDIIVKASDEIKLLNSANLIVDVDGSLDRLNHLVRTASMSLELDLLHIRNL